MIGLKPAHTTLPYIQKKEQGLGGLASTDNGISVACRKTSSSSVTLNLEQVPVEPICGTDIDVSCITVMMKVFMYWMLIAYYYSSNC